VHNFIVTKSLHVWLQIGFNIQHAFFAWLFIVIKYWLLFLV